jgi:hypothetical protein
MSWLLIAVAGWLVVAAVVGLFAWGLARAAAVGDRDRLEQLAFARAVAEEQAPERRRSPEDRRAATRPWAAAALGRRAEDLLRQDLAEAHRALRDAEARLAEIEARESA